MKFCWECRVHCSAVSAVGVMSVFTILQFHDLCPVICWSIALTERLNECQGIRKMYTHTTQEVSAGLLRTLFVDCSLFKSTVATISTILFKRCTTFAFGQNNLFIYFVWLSKYTAIIFLSKISGNGHAFYFLWSKNWIFLYILNELECCYVWDKNTVFCSRRTEWREVLF